MDIVAFKEQLFKAGTAKGFTDMEIYYQSSQRFNTQVFKGEIDAYQIAVEGGLSFRGLINGKMGYSYTEKIDKTEIDFLITEAADNAAVIEDEDPEELFPGSESYEDVTFFSDELAKIEAEEKINVLKEAEAECFALSDKVHSVNYCILESRDGETFIANTKGLEKQEKRNFVYIVLSAVVKSGEEFKSAMKYWVTDDFASFSPKEMAKEVVDEALSFMNASSIKSKNYPIILRNSAAASLLQAFSSSFSAENVQKGKSMLAGKLNEAIGAANITIIDDPHYKAGTASQSFDGEGVATHQLKVVEQGVLKTYLHNLKSARKDGVKSTGHAFKPSYKGTISISPSNMYIEPGDKSLNELIKAEDEALLITDLQGLHSGADPISGDFSLAANGYLVKNGAIARPVDQITVAGNFFDLLNQVETIGDDVSFSIMGTGYLGSPSLKITKLSVGGE
ncbi:peptidase U62 modulator of DNA gyrase [Alkalihalobacillus alcalophilus ATCC 27647 = CGMCC 1.3604]|uniref:Peptidase U62 modulator of DNA gyrase n=1 Tax=Alkalihalobacillus alcalophilus ATCC 27647 = CGMCC 1.3604 TaxID=1218173 RepID=A0A4S4JTU0_ALKAL|nr:TldD/PmbA family protein [Alkalihalobacillus alcalophilus]MED1561777.1 TldD/PmbA family protein [Alkalihalobacillus alcalophilus]THG88563.1 peptidase U62 modulator of DNA gyrase [Alkalihalobacillus alcalophilus ATCC 27647 = CGMCC 1.3604]